MVVDKTANIRLYGSECVGCGACEKRCPFGVNVRDNMSGAAKLFGI